uniref:DNA-directed RNA polymerase n=2 Tax=Auxenochlorella protothecoides TaxID=3075 RepID=A0A023HHQ0_AUXPR|nr:beta' subunit of RNA polymerase [Auxenochlorella protothecoides]AGL10868.1 beta' subunit of RNA polymerase [Auxenochlorella protothecoides]AGN72510.1 beta subunit of RNA polymerase [Auxenochlorella protothecoides]
MNQNNNKQFFFKILSLKKSKIKKKYFKMNNSKFSNLQSKINNSFFFNGPFDKGKLKKLITCFLDEYGEKNTLEFLEKLKHLGFSQATQAGISLGLDDLKIPNRKGEFLLQTNIALQTTEYENLAGNITSIEKSQRTIDIWNTTSELLRENVIENFKYKNPLNSLSMMAFSGARGNVSQVRQLVGMRGLMADPQGAIVEFPIQSNFREGITLTEYLISCYGARKGLVDTALRTATSGYLTRRLVDTVQHIVVSSADCGTGTGLLINNPDNETRLIGRVLLKKINKNFLDRKKINNYYPFFLDDKKFDFNKNETFFIKKNQIISSTIAKQIYANQDKIYIRSPLTCQSYKSICQLCYGWDLAKGDLVNIGEAVGVIAAQSIGEPGTQLTMRTFHTGGVGVFSDESLKTFKAPSSGIINFPENITGSFIRTPHGKIVYMIKYNRIDPTRILLEIKTKKSNKSFFTLYESQLPPGSILLVRQGQNVQINDIIAQTPQIKTSNQNLPESLHPIQSKIEGEVRFEYMKISVSQPISKFNVSFTDNIQQNSFLSQTESQSKGLINNYLLNSSKTLIPIKGVVPMTHSLLEVGSFWVFHAHNQREPYSTNTFLQIGDLISSQSPIFQVNFHVLFQAKLKRIHAKIVIERPILNIPTNIIRFHKTAYSSTSYNKNKSVFFWSNTISHKNRKFKFVWYPKNWSIKSSGFIFLSKKYIKFNGLQKKVKPNKIFKKNVINLFYFKVLQEKLNKSKSYNISLNHKLSDNKLSYFGNLFYLSYIFLSLENDINLNKLFLASTNIELFKFFKGYKTPSIFLINNISDVLFKPGFYKILSKPINKLRYSSKNKKPLKYKFNLFKSKKLTKKYNNSLKFLANSNNCQIIIGQFVFLFLDKFQIKSTPKKPKNIFHYEKNWTFFSPSKTLNTSFSSFNKSTKKFILTKNAFLTNFSFVNQPVSLEYLLLTQINVLQKKNLNHCQYSQPYWYSKKNLLNIKYSWKSTCHLRKKSFFNNISFKQIDKTLIFYTLQIPSKLNNKLNFSSIKKISLNNNIEKNLLCISIQKLNQNNFPCNLNLQKQWGSLIFKSDKSKFFVNNTSPVFSKQTTYKTSYKEVSNKLFIIQPDFNVGWHSPTNLMKIKLELKTQKNFKGFYSGFVSDFYKTNSKSNLKNISTKERKKAFKRESFYLGSYIHLPKENFVFDHKNLNFQTFSNEWVLPNIKLAVGFKTSTISGEFIRLKKSLNQTYWSSLSKDDIVTLNLPSKATELTLRVGQILRWGQPIYHNFVSPFNGQIIKINQGQLSIRRGLPILASKRGIIHISDNDLILKNKLLVTLKSRRLETQDIVQGIPKIEQLFEARETLSGEKLPSIHKKLQLYFLDALDMFYKNSNQVFSALTPQQQKVHYFEIANKMAVIKIQNFIVENIIDAYLNQGVSVSEKHVEIVVREMTTRVRILSSGATGFLPGEIIQFKTVQEINNKLYNSQQSPAFYDPIILGITKSVLHSESFLLAASFQEVSRILVRSACIKKTDFLSGLHENVIVGQLIPAGAVLFSKLPKKYTI